MDVGRNYLSKEFNRRNFLRGGLAVAATGISFQAWCKAHGADYDFLSAGEKFGWTPKLKGAFVFIHATDLHMTENPDWDRGALQMKDKFMGRCFVDEVNAMNALPVKPSAIFLTGDLTSSTTMNPRTWDRAEKKWAHFRKYVTDRLEVKCYQFIGNNDCAAVPYKKVFPERPLYWSLAQNGMTMVGLHGYNLWKPENTNHAGILYDAEQLAWLKSVVATSRSRTLVIFTHEPLTDGDSHAACAQLAPILALFKGEEIWNIAGHNHFNSVSTVTLGGRTLHCVQTMTPVGEGFTLGDGGYRVFYGADGLIYGSALRWLTQNGEPIGYAPSAIKTNHRQKLLGEWFPSGALSVALVGRDRFDIEGSVRIENRIADYYICRPNKQGIPGKLVWKVPRMVKGKKVTKVRIQCGKIAGKAGISCDGSTWSYSEVKWAADNSVRELVLPATHTGEYVWLSLANESKFECKFYGYALFG